MEKRNLVHTLQSNGPGKAAAVRGNSNTVSKGREGEENFWLAYLLFSPTPACIEGGVPLFIDEHDFGRIALHISLYKGKMRALSLVRRSKSECELVG